MAQPDFLIETALRERNFKIIAGIDEVGRGPLAGPVVAAAVILDPDNIPNGLQDSKKLSAKRREAVFDEILSSSRISVASIPAGLIDTINIRQATMLAMTNAAKGLEITPDWHLIDGNFVPPDLKSTSDFIIKGDAKSLSIAAASIVAKVIRDRMMATADTIYPGYDFGKHAGYGTKAHLEAIERLGPCPLHRMTFRPLKAA